MPYYVYFTLVKAKPAFAHFCNWVMLRCVTSLWKDITRMHPIDKKSQLCFAFLLNMKIYVLNSLLIHKYRFF
jgi:hypothetical protein